MSSAQPQTQAVADQRLSRGRVLSYAFGDVANNVAFMMTSLFLMAYMTEIAGVSAAAAGVIYGVTKIWAGIADLTAGQVVGRRQTRFGRLRPWVMFGSLPLVASLVLLFSTPAGLSPTMVLVWILLFDALFQLAYSFVNIPYGSMSAVLTQNPVDRSRLAGARSIAASVTGVILATILSPQFKDTTGDDIRLKFTITTLILAAIAIGLYAICFFGSKEVIPASAEKPRLANTFKMVGKNKPLLVLCFGAFFLLGAGFTMMAVQMYYARFVLGDASYFIWLQLANTVGTITIASFVPALTVKLGKRVGYVVMAIIATLAFVLIGLTPTGGAENSMALIVGIAAFFVFGLGFGGTNAMMFSMQADTVDYGEWDTGVRSEGGSYSILSFVRKCGQGLGGFASGAIIAAFGYVPKVAEQSAEAQFGIKVAAGWIPAALAVVAGLVIFFYPLTAAKHAGIVSDLNERRARRAAEESAGAALGVGAAGELVAERPVVTFNEQYGAGATYVATRVAERLDVPFIGSKFTSEDLAEVEAAAAAASGSGDAGVATFLRSMSRTGVDADSSVAANQEADHEIVRENTADIIGRVSGDGGALVGRDGCRVLAGMDGAFHVRLEAPVQSRIERAAQLFGISPAMASERQVREDRMRTAMSERLMHYDQTDRSHYDLVIDTGSTSLDDAVDQIVAAYTEKYPNKR